MRRTVSICLVAVGIVCLAAALGLFTYNRVEADRADAAATEILDEVWEAMPAYAYPDDDALPTIPVDGYEYIGTISIPRFGLDLPVQSEWSYAGLRVAPCRFSGSAWTNDLVIAAHNYERHFGNVRYLDPGDVVRFIDVLGNVFDYEVVVLDDLAPDAVEEMTSSGYPLTLFTCTPGGRTRVTVRCDLVDDER